MAKSEKLSAKAQLERIKKGTDGLISEELALKEAYHFNRE